LRRRQWHAQVAEALEQGPGEAPVEQVAYHYLRAGVDEKAVVYLERAGDRALALYGNAEAEGYYRDLFARLETLGRSLEAARVLEKLGKLLDQTGRCEEALEMLAQAERVYQRTGNQEQHLLLLAQMGQVYVHRLAAAEGLQRLLPVLEAA